MTFSTTYPLPCGAQQVLDVDATPSGDFLALLGNGDVVTTTGRLSLGRPFRYPLIRRLDAHRFVIVEGIEEQAPNAHVFDEAGRRVASFHVGDGVEDVLVHAGCLVVAYFDEGVLDGRQPAADGLAVFEADGRQVFGYNSSHAPFLLDCHGLCRWGPDQVLAYPYPEAPLLLLRLSDHHVQRLPVPSGFDGVAAVSEYRGGVVYYVAPPGKAAYFGWRTNDRVRRHYVAAGRVRGLDEGHFLSHDAPSFTIIDAAAALHLDQ